MLSWDKLHAILLLSGATLPPRSIRQEPNPYDQGQNTAGPKWVVELDIGTIIIHWRKRVLEIDWAGTCVRFPMRDQFGRADIKTDDQLTFDDVTQTETMVHAWGYPKAIQYLQRLIAAEKRMQYLLDFERRKEQGLLDAEEQRLLAWYSSKKEA